MKFLRAGLILALLAGPVLALVAVGGWLMWQHGVTLWLWWVLPICWGLAYLLAKRWQGEFAPLPTPELHPAAHWTPRDRQALEIVEDRQRAVKTIPQERLVEPRFFLDTAIELATRISRHYYPHAREPLDSLTVPEILAVAHLAFEDLEQWSRDYIPASHLLTVRQWRLLGKAPGWMQAISNLGWFISILAYPGSIARHLVSRWTMHSAKKQLQANVLAWFYVMFVRQVGFYAIEMNSGRLRDGAAHYRNVVAAGREQAADTAGGPREGKAEARPAEVRPVTVAVVGKAKAGKSSLINALLGEERAETDVLPLTGGIQRYALKLAGSPEALSLLDTVGYAAEEASPEQIAETLAAFETAELVLLVIDVTSPGRKADVELVRGMAKWFDARRELKPPPVLGVLTHIDGLTPVRQWNPPYNWQQPASVKERNIREALEYNREQFGPLLAGLVPVCSDVRRNRVYGVQQWLLPAMVALLGESRGCAVVRALHERSESRPVRQIFHQLQNTGTTLLKAYVSGLQHGSLPGRNR